MGLVITKRMQSLMDCIDELYNQEGNTNSKLEIVAGSYSDTYKDINGIRPRHICMKSWTYEDYIITTNLLMILQKCIGTSKSRKN